MKRNDVFYKRYDGVFDGYINEIPLPCDESKPDEFDREEMVIPNSIWDNARDMYGIEEPSAREKLIGACFSVFMIKYVNTDSVYFPVVYHKAGTESVKIIKSNITSDTTAKEAIAYYQNNMQNTETVLQQNMFSEDGCMEKSFIKTGLLFSEDSILQDVGNHIFKGLHFLFYCKMSNSQTKIGVCYLKKYKVDSVKAMLVHWLEIVKKISVCPHIVLSRLCILTDREVQQITMEWNKTEQDFPQTACLHTLIEKQAADNPNALAVIQDDCRITRGELNEKANQLANYLLRINVKSNDVIGIYIDKSIDMVISLLAVLKAGCAYLPIDVEYPLSRIQYIIHDSNMRVMISKSWLLDNVSCDEKIQVVCLDSQESEINEQSSSNPCVAAKSTDLCYLIYTSGSTGDPKGVMLDHRGRVNNFIDFNRRFHIHENDTVLAISSLSFDMCAYDVFGTLMAGGVIVLPNTKYQHQPVHWLKLISQHEITIWHSVPVLLNLLCDIAQIRKTYSMTSLRLFLLGGDWIPVSLPDKARALAGTCTLISLGGATEVSMDSILYTVEKVDAAWKSIPYGKPMANQKAYILDAWQQPVPIGVPGELLIGGIGVGKGYYNKPKLTEERFLENPWMPGEKIYKTGDQARYMEDGTIQLIGRLDYQVKINGERIELCEIETHLKRYPTVQDAVVMAREGLDRKKTLVAYIVTDPAKSELDFKKLKSYLLERLSINCLPHAVVWLDSLPLTPNGKINRKQLGCFEEYELISF